MKLSSYFGLALLLVAGCVKAPAPAPPAAPVTAPPVAAVDAPELAAPAVPVAPAIVAPTPKPTPIAPSAPATTTPLRELVGRYLRPGSAAPDEKVALEFEKLAPLAAELWPLLADQEASVRCGAAFLLVDEFDPAHAEQVAAFVALLGDEDGSVRSLGLSGLARMRPADQIAALPQLLKLLDSQLEPKAENRVRVVRVCGKLKSDALPALDALLAAATDPAGEVRAASLVALTQVAPPEKTLPALTKGLADEDAAVRLVAAAQLRKLGAAAESAAAQLVAALEDQDVRVRDAAGEALIKIGAPAVEPLAAKLAAGNLEARKLALACLAKLGPTAKTALPAVDKCLQDPHPEVKKLAEVAARNIKG
ncbi:MAG: HEAT repeat domain-containing protein [Pirellulaceae bacterium]|nr:HEAT repeat domain-containing protein [Pirellulaceae bacterium]